MARIALFLAIVLSLATGLVAGEWSRYVNPLSGIGIDVPAGFSPQPEGTGVRKVFAAQGGRAKIEIWSEADGRGAFTGEMQARIAADEAEGWSITYRSETPDWAAWTGNRSGHVFYARTISTCGGRNTGHVRLSYPAADAGTFDALASRLGQSLAQDGACF